MKTTSSIRKLRTLLRGIQAGTLVPQPEFQRRLVWTNKDKLEFLDTVLSGYPFPEIYIASGTVDLDTGEGIELLVDGQQRLSTLYQYFTNSDALRLGRTVASYSSLSETEKISFLEYEVVVRDLGVMDREKIIQIFQKINNTSYSLNAMEVHNARYAGAFKQFGEKIANRSFFREHKIFSANEIRRMGDVRFALTFIITIMSTYFNRDSLLADYLRNYNEEFEDDSISFQVDRILNFVEACNLHSDSRAWKTSDLLTLLVELHTIIFKQQQEISAPQVRTRLSRFYHEVDNRQTLNATNVPSEILEEYFRAAVQATNDRSNRIRRGEIIQRVLLGEFDLSRSAEGWFQETAP